MRYVDPWGLSPITPVELEEAYRKQHQDLLLNVFFGAGGILITENVLGNLKVTAGDINRIRIEKDLSIPQAVKLLHKGVRRWAWKITKQKNGLKKYSSS